MDKTEEDLILDILGGDANAYAVLVKRYQKPLFNLMLRMNLSEMDALDLTQDAFVRAYEKLEAFNPSGRFFTWLYTIGLNLARDFLRRAKRAQAHQSEMIAQCKDRSADSTGGEGLVERLDADRISESLGKLPLEYREAVILRYHEGMPVKEIALALNLSVSGAKMRIHRGLLRLRDLLGGEKFDDR